jgi:cysteine desulfuration protein SufE
VKFDKLIRRFQAADRDLRLETLLEASKKLPDLPPALAQDRDRESHRVTECQTPVFLWIEREGDRIRFYADVPRESPTVRGFVALLQSNLDGATPAELADLPLDLLHELRLDDALGMMRSQGLAAIVSRVKRAGQALAAEARSEAQPEAQSGPPGP